MQASFFPEFNLTKFEESMLNDIVDSYSPYDNICYSEPLTPEQKGVVGSLVKKGLIYDANGQGKMDSADDKFGHNFFPSAIVMDVLGLPYYGLD